MIVFQSVEPRRKGPDKSIAQMPLTGYFVRDAKRDPRSSFFLRGKSSDPLWWDVAHPTFLQQAEVEQETSRLPSTAAKAFGLSLLGNDCGPAFCDHYGPAPYQQDRHSAIQRRFSGDARVGEIPRPKYLAPVLEASCSQKHQAAGASSRQPARLS